MPEGEMPRESDSWKTMGLVRNQKKVQQHGSPDGLQRALEGEMVNMLRQQNSKLMDELQFLRAKLEKGSMGKPASGMESSPWSALDGSADSSNGFVGTLPPERHGRHGSRTPRSKIRDAAVSPEKRDSKKYTPNGTHVPDGPPPDSRELPPVPPFPVPAMGGQDGDVSFCSGLYDTCESKSKVKNGDVAWKPQEPCEGSGILSPSEAKQVWLECEVRSLKSSLDRVSIPPMLQQSEYWNAGFDNCVPATGLGQHATAVRMPGDPFGAFGGSGTDALRDRALHGGGGNDDLRHRAFGSAHSVPGGVRAA